MFSGKLMLRVGALALVFVVAGALSLTSPPPVYAAAEPLLAEIIMQVVKFDGSIRLFGGVEPDALPARHPDRLLLALLVKFPIQIRMCFLRLIPA